jgi:hypothetical protein
MHYNASPGPDGFGPSFYKLTWPIVSPTVLSIFQSFHSGRAELERVNRSHIILLPKNGSARGAADFRPITLQTVLLRRSLKSLQAGSSPLFPRLLAATRLGSFLGGALPRASPMPPTSSTAASRETPLPSSSNWTSTKPLTLSIGIVCTRS